MVYDFHSKFARERRKGVSASPNRVKSVRQVTRATPIVVPVRPRAVRIVDRQLTVS